MLRAAPRAPIGGRHPPTPGPGPVARLSPKLVIEVALGLLAMGFGVDWRSRLAMDDSVVYERKIESLLTDSIPIAFMEAGIDSSLVLPDLWSRYRTQNCAKLKLFINIFSPPLDWFALPLSPPPMPNGYQKMHWRSIWDRLCEGWMSHLKLAINESAKKHKGEWQLKSRAAKNVISPRHPTFPKKAGKLSNKARKGIRSMNASEASALLRAVALDYVAWEKELRDPPPAPEWPPRPSSPQPSPQPSPSPQLAPQASEQQSEASSCVIRLKALNSMWRSRLIKCGFRDRHLTKNRKALRKAVAFYWSKWESMEKIHKVLALARYHKAQTSRPRTRMAHGKPKMTRFSTKEGRRIFLYHVDPTKEVPLESRWKYIDPLQQVRLVNEPPPADNGRKSNRRKNKKGKQTKTKKRITGKEKKQLLEKMELEMERRRRNDAKRIREEGELIKDQPIDFLPRESISSSSPSPKKVKSKTPEEIAASPMKGRRNRRTERKEEDDLESKLRANTLRIGSWNPGTLTLNEEELLEAMREFDIDAVAVQETRYPIERTTWTIDSDFVFVGVGRKSNPNSGSNSRGGGVGWVLRKDLKVEAIPGIVNGKIESRIEMYFFKATRGSLTLALGSVYWRPGGLQRDLPIDDFCEKVNMIREELKDRIVIAGDFNAPSSNELFNNGLREVIERCELDDAVLPGWVTHRAREGIQSTRIDHLFYGRHVIETRSLLYRHWLQECGHALIWADFGETATSFEKRRRDIYVVAERRKHRRLELVKETSELGVRLSREIYYKSYKMRDSPEKADEYKAEVKKTLMKIDMDRIPIDKKPALLCHIIQKAARKVVGQVWHGEGRRYRMKRKRIGDDNEKRRKERIEDYNKEANVASFFWDESVSTLYAIKRAHLIKLQYAYVGNVPEVVRATLGKNVKCARKELKKTIRAAKRSEWQLRLYSLTPEEDPYGRRAYSIARALSWKKLKVIIKGVTNEALRVFWSIVWGYHPLPEEERATLILLELRRRDAAEEDGTLLSNSAPTLLFILHPNITIRRGRGRNNRSNRNETNTLENDSAPMDMHPAIQEVTDELQEEVVSGIDHQYEQQPLPSSFLPSVPPPPPQPPLSTHPPSPPPSIIFIIIKFCNNTVTIADFHARCSKKTIHSSKSGFRRRT